MAPMLPPMEEEKSVLHSAYKGDKSVMQNLSQADHHSLASLPLSHATRRSNFTMLSLRTGQPEALPKDRKLKEMAEKRITSAQLREIDSNLKKINDTDDLSYAKEVSDNELRRAEGGEVALRKRLIDPKTLESIIEECREEEERR
mmetsp:Transcript_25701/g.19428  ORF Transcript_25701/g.19428 Transcript_25701/m.19428 type:complete len:145 (+) Transcript_25701:1899-2333(+)